MQTSEQVTTLGGLMAITSLVLVSCAGTGPPDSNVPREKREPSIHWAAMHGRVERVKDYLSEGGDPSVRDRSGSTLLHAASIGSEIEVARSLIEAGADVDARDKYDATPLHVSNGHVKMMRFLLDHGADVKAIHAGGGATMLHGLCYAGRKEAVRVLLEYGADVDAECWGLGSTQLPVPDELNGEPGKNERPRGLTPLHVLTPNDSVEIAQMLLDAGADVNAKALLGFTPLHCAASHGDERLVEFLLDHGAEVNAHWQVWGTPLDAAAFADREYMGAFLRRHGARTGRELGKDGVAEAVWTVKKELHNPTLEKVKSLVKAPLQSARLRFLDAVFDGPLCVVHVLVNGNEGGRLRFKVHKETGAIVDVEPSPKRKKDGE